MALCHSLMLCDSMTVTDPSALSRLNAVLNSPDAEDRLMEAALLVAQTRDARLDVSACLRQIGDWADYLRSQTGADNADAADKIASLNRFLFDELGFTGNVDDYFDPRNSFMDAVIERRLGIPITLSVLYIELGRRIGLPLQGVSFPGHFLVMLPVSHGAVVLDPFAHGASLDMDDLEQFLQQAQPQGRPDSGQIRALLVPASTTEILIRMLRNLKAIYWQRKDLLDALWVQDLLLAIDRDLVEERRDRGILHQEIGYFPAAIEDFTAYLSQSPNAVDAELIRSRLIDLNTNPSRVH